MERPNELPIALGEVVLGPEGIRFDFKRPLQRTKEALSIRLNIDSGWEPEPPWDSIRMQDGRRIKITASLVSTGGKVFDSNLVGRADGVDLRFIPPPPRDVQIIALILKSDLPLRCHSARWYEYNPL